MIIIDDNNNNSNNGIIKKASESVCAGVRAGSCVFFVKFSTSKKSVVRWFLLLYDFICSCACAFFSWLDVCFWHVSVWFYFFFFFFFSILIKEIFSRFSNGKFWLVKFSNEFEFLCMCAHTQHARIHACVWFWCFFWGGFACVSFRFEHVSGCGCVD